MIKNCICYSLALVFSVGLINSVNATSVELTKNDLVAFQEIVKLAKEKKISEAELVSLIREECEKEEAQMWSRMLSLCYQSGDPLMCFALGGLSCLSFLMVTLGVGCTIGLVKSYMVGVGVEDFDSDFSEDDSHED